MSTEKMKKVGNARKDSYCIFSRNIAQYESLGLPLNEALSPLY